MSQAYKTPYGQRFWKLKARLTWSPEYQPFLPGLQMEKEQQSLRELGLAPNSPVSGGLNPGKKSQTQGFWELHIILGHVAILTLLGMILGARWGYSLERKLKGVGSTFGDVDTK